MIIISKVFIIWSTLCLCANREYPGSFQNKAVSSKPFSRMSAHVKWDRRPFWSGQALIYPLNYLLHLGVMLTTIKVFIILFLLCLWEQGTRWQFSKQISKLSFQLSFLICSLLAQTEGQKRSFLEGCKKGDHIVRLSPRALG